MKPVELEIFLQDEISPGLKKAGQTVQGFSDDSKKRLRELSESVKIQRDVVKQLENQYKELGKSLKNAAPGQQWFDVKAQMGNVKAELDAEKAALQDLTEQQRKLKNEAENAGTSLRQQLRNVREEIATLLLAYRSLSEQEKQTAQGQQLARYIDELTEKAGELNDAIGDTAQAVRNAASDTRSFDQLAGGVQLVVDGFGLATAGAEALGLSEASLAEVQTRLQTALVASNALSSMQVNLQKQSALMQGINVIQTKAAATAENIRTWAVGRGVIATKAATIAQAAFNKIAKANPYVLLAMGVTTVVGALYAFAKGSDAAKKADEERQREIEEAKMKEEEFKKTIVDSAAASISKYLQLKQSWEQLGNSFAARKKFITDHKDAFNELGVQINTVADAQRYLVEMTDKAIEALARQSIADAFNDNLKEKIAPYVKKWDENRTPVELRMKAGTAVGAALVNVETGKEDGIGALANINEISREEIESVVDLLKKSDGFYYMTDEAIKAVNQRRKDNALRAQEAAQAQMLDISTEYAKEISNQEQKVAEIYKELGITQIDPHKPEPPRKPEVDRVAIARKEAEELRKFRWQNEQDEINQLADGAERRRRQIALDYERELAEIEARRKEFAELNASAGVTGLDASGLTEAQAAEIARAAENAAARRKAELAGIYEELAGQYKTYAEQRLEIEAKYDAEVGALRDARRQAEAAGDREAAERLGRGIAEATRARGKALLEHDFGVLRESPEYVRAFEDLRNTSTETLEGLRGELERLKGTAAGLLTPQELREYTTTLGEIMAEIDSRDPLGTLARRARELGETERALADARGRLERVQRGERVFTGLKVESVDAQGRPKVVATYLSAADALKQYTAAKDRHRKASNEYKKAEDAATETVKGLTEAIKGAGESLGDTAGMAVGLIMDMGMFVSDTIKGIETVARTGEDAVSAVEKASVILTIVSAALQLLRRISELGNGAHAEYEAYAAKVDEINALTRAVTDYRMAVLEARQEESRWFAEEGLGELRRWKEYHDEVWRAYVEKAGEAQAVYHNESGGGWLTGAINWLTGNLSALSWWKEWRDIWGQGGYDEGTTAAINNLRIETRKKSSGFLGTGIGGHSQKTEDLATWARRNGLGELFDEKGLINKELAQSLIDNYGNKLVGQTKETLEALIELRERYDEYVEKLHEYVSSMYEPLVGNMVDGLWDWYDEGKDALDSLKGYASETFRDIVSDLLRTIALEKVVGSFDDDIAALYEKYAEGGLTEEELMREVARLTEGLLGRYEANIPVMEGILDNVAGMLAGAGIDLKDGGDGGRSQSGKAGAFTAMSQDQGTKLEGLMTSVQGHVAHIDGWLTEDVSARMSAAEGYLARIAENTKANAELAGEIKELIVQLIRDGLKMR